MENNLLLQLASEAVPILFLVGLATVILIADLWWREQTKAPLTAIVTLGLGFTMALAWSKWERAGLPRAAALLYFDRITWMGGLVVLAATLLAYVSAVSYVRARDLPIGEFSALLLYGAAGMWLMIATTHLLMVFLGLETLSLAAYVLAGFHRTERRSIEAAIKYFLLGAIAAAFLLFGLAFLYGGTASLDLLEIARVVGAGQLPLDRLYTMTGAAFLTIGLGFKIAAVPFQFWTPDVYEGAPLPVTAFFATGVKAGAFVVLLRVAQQLLPAMPVPWEGVLWFLAIATMTVGNLAALIQEDVKRMLAYSSIAHAGYALIAIGIVGAPSLFFYLIAYTVMTIGAFTVLIALSRETREETDLAVFTGLATRQPWLAAAMAVFLLSLAGVPPTIGFFAKYYLFQAAVGAGQVGIVIIAVLNSVVSVAYYIRPIIAMYFRRAPEGAPLPVVAPLGVNLVLACTGVAVIALGLFPGPLLAILLQTAR